MKADNVYQNGRDDSFVVFNDGDLSMEPITDEDIRPCTVKQPPSVFIQSLRSQTWSCDIQWFFIIYDSGIMLLNVYSDQGFMCRKKSAMFIKAFLDAPPSAKKCKRSPATTIQ